MSAMSKGLNKEESSAELYTREKLKKIRELTKFTKKILSDAC